MQVSWPCSAGLKSFTGAGGRGVVAVKTGAIQFHEQAFVSNMDCLVCVQSKSCKWFRDFAATQPGSRSFVSCSRHKGHVRLLSGLPCMT